NACLPSSFTHRFGRRLYLDDNFTLSVSQPSLILELQPMIFDEDFHRKELMIALVEQDYSVKSFLVRGIGSWGSCSYQREKCLVRTFSLQLKKILMLGIVQSLPFQQVKSTIKDYILFLERV
ncbi:hypothetical protein H5410_014447, partial [Solanum commersonii]